MTSDYVIVSIKLCPEVGNDGYIIVCNFGGRRISGCDVIEGGLRGARRSQEAKKKPGLNRIIQASVGTGKCTD